MSGLGKPIPHTVPANLQNRQKMRCAQTRILREQNDTAGENYCRKRNTLPKCAMQIITRFARPR